MNSATGVRASGESTRVRACRTSTRCARRCARTTRRRWRGGRRRAFAVRFERFFTELRDPLVALYGDDARFAAAWERLLGAIARTAAERPRRAADARPRARDHARLAPARAGRRLRDLRRPLRGDAGRRARRLPYLRELGVTYLHLMPLLHARPAPNDGGYAVIDYGAVDPALGTMDDLRALATDLRDAGMALCVDLVLNHTAAEHAWTRAIPASTGRSRTARSPTRTSARCPTSSRTPRPGASRRSATAGSGRRSTPTSGTSTTRTPTSSWRWPRRCSGWPQVGVDVLRLDAAPFLWKRLGTNCQNQPEVHELLQAFRAAMRIAAPAVAFKAEAIVAPADLVPYLGTGKHEGKECDLAYHNVLMVLLWSALASGRVALMTSTLRAMPPVPPGAGWLTYVRCHDDIGWAITPEDAGARRRGRLPAPALPGRLLRGRVPGHVRARGALPARPAHGRGAHVAAPARRWRGWRARRTRSRSSSRCGACCSCTRSRSRTAGCR